MEEWKSIEGYDGKYLISNYGRVKSLYDNKGNYREKIRKLRVAKNGYLYLNLFKNYKSRTYKVHRLVATYFLDKVDGKNVVNHKDGNKLNNNVNNLEWVTLSENTTHAIKLGLFNPNENLKNKADYGYKKVNQYSLDDKFIKQWDSIKEAQFVLNISHISDVCKGKRKMAGGYQWKYVI